MNFFTWLATKRKTLSTMTVAELRAEELLLQNECARMQARISKVAHDKQAIVTKGAQEKTPELRRTWAQQFDLLHNEQMMTARHLNIRSKETLTVSRLRMLRDNEQRMRMSSGSRALIRDQDLSVIEKLIENDAISTEMYQERLDEILKIGHEQDEAALAGVSPAAQELLNVWDAMDHGLIKDEKAAFDEAEKRVRERGKAAE